MQTARLNKDVYHTPSMSLEKVHAAHLGIVTEANAKPSITAGACEHDTPTGKCSRVKLSRLALGENAQLLQTSHFACYVC